MPIKGKDEIKYEMTSELLPAALWLVCTDMTCMLLSLAQGWEAPQSKLQGDMLANVLLYTQDRGTFGATRLWWQIGLMFWGWILIYIKSSSDRALAFPRGGHYIVRGGTREEQTFIVSYIYICQCSSLTLPAPHQVFLNHCKTLTCHD